MFLWPRALHSPLRSLPGEVPRRPSEGSPVRAQKPIPMAPTRLGRSTLGGCGELKGQGRRDAAVHQRPDLSISSNFFLALFSLSFPSGTPIMYILDHFIFSHSPWDCSFFFHFPLFFRLHSLYWSDFNLLLNLPSQVFNSLLFSCRICIWFFCVVPVLCWDSLFTHFEHIFLYLFEIVIIAALQSLSNIWTILGSVSMDCFFLDYGSHFCFFVWVVIFDLTPDIVDNTL